MKREETLNFLEAIADRALEEARAGNTGLANELGRNAATAHYFNNVATTRRMSANDWAAYYPAHMTEADRLREQYEQGEAVVEAVTRLESLEEKFDKLLETMEQLQTPAKPKRKSRKVKEAVEETDDTETDEEPVEDDDTTETDDSDDETESDA